MCGITECSFRITSCGIISYGICIGGQVEGNQATGGLQWHFRTSRMWLRHCNNVYGGQVKSDQRRPEHRARYYLSGCSARWALCSGHTIAGLSAFQPMWSSRMDPALLLPLLTRVRHKIAPARFCGREPFDRWVERADSPLSAAEDKHFFALSSPVGFAQGFHLDNSSIA